jgi:uncharacterized protein YjbI with pentapeptide repeats
MAETSAKVSQEFDPPKYLASLIAAINDGAKAAQTGALAFAFVGVYLLAAAFSASDEDLLRARAVTISQIGASLPVTFSFAIAPFVFVFLHIYTLARYDMLAANVRQFLVDLQRTVPWEVDRERCRQLLANVEFIPALVATQASRLYSPLWRWLVRAVIVVFPVLVLLLLQINSLRYQSASITWSQRVWLFIDLSALVLFFYRNPLKSPEENIVRPRLSIWRWRGLLWLPAVLGLNLLYLGIVPPNADPHLVRYERPRNLSVMEATQKYLTDAVSQPLDVLLCPPPLRWGCRYLHVDRRTLVDHVWDDAAIVDLWRGSSDKAKALAAIEGLVLRDRSFRFAMLDDSSLFSADLTGADLRNASLEDARLSGAQLPGAKLQGADLQRAELQGANLISAQLRGTNLALAQLRGTYLSYAQLRAAVLSGAQLQGATLTSADLTLADLRGAQLQGAGLRNATLVGADLSSAQLQGADLRAARLWGATFGRMEQQSGADFWPETDLSLSDLRKADFTTRLSGDEKADLRAAICAIPENDILRQKAAKRLDQLLVPAQSPALLHFGASPGQPVVVSNIEDPMFKGTENKWLISSPDTTALTKLLVDTLAKDDSAVAGGIALRAVNGVTDPEDHSLYTVIGCRLIESTKAGNVKLDPQLESLLSTQLHQMKIDCR